MVIHYNENEHEYRMEIIHKYEASEEKQEVLNEVTNRSNIFMIKVTSQYPDIWFNELYNLNLKFDEIK